MIRKILWIFVAFFPLFLLLSPRISFSQYSDKPSISIFYQDRPVGGIIEFSSVQDPKIQAVAYQSSGPAKVEIFQASLDDAIQYLIHDDKFQQIYPKVDTSKLSHLSDLNVNLTDKPQDISLPLSGTGIFFVRLSQGQLISQSYIIRSPFATIAREAKDSLVLWSQDFSTKKSITGGTATLYSLQGQKKVIGTSNLDGDAIASLPLSKDADIAVVDSQGAIALVPLNARYLNGDYSWLTFRENQTQRRYFIFTDRPIYKPGDTVNFKAIVRDDDDARYSMPQGSVKVEVSQGYDNRIFLLKDTLNINPNGYINSSFTIPKTAKTGEYRIKLNPDTIPNYEWDDNGNGDSIYFKVENYRKPEYFINAESPQVNVVRGDSVDIKINGEYYSGQPLANATVNYKVTSSDNGYYESDRFYEDNGNHYYRSWYGSDVETGSVTLDSKGRAKITLPTNKNDSKGSHQVFFFEFTYKDATGNPSTTGVNVLVRSGEYSIYRDGNYSYGGKPNEKINLPFILKSNQSGLTLSHKVDVTVVRHWWEEVNNQNSKYPTYNPKEDEFGKYSFTTDSSGKSIFDFTPDKSGNYEVKTEITDSRGNVVKKSFYYWVSDQYNYFNGYSNNSPSLRIITDKTTYYPNDNAIISISSDIPDRDIFIAFERGYQDRYQIVHLTGKETTFQTKIYPHDVPNMYLTAKTFDADGLAGSVQNLSIDTTGKQAFFSITTDKQNYAPGDEVTVNVKAVDSSGGPLETNFALWSVDKAIFALTDKNYGDVFKQFWNNRYNNTVEANSLEGILVIGAAEKGGCFLTGTKVKMGDNSDKNIEEIKIGDKVLTRISPNSSKLVSTPVTAIHKTTAPDYLIINQSLRVTGNHLLYINGQWRQAGLVQIGDELISSEGKVVKVSSIERLRGQSSVYNLTTDVYHTYFADNYYVHNQKGSSPRDNFADTAYWNVSVNTNSQGLAQVKFKLPDNLTTWVITALGATVDTRVGEAFAEIKVNKDLVIRPALPNVLGDNDSVAISALVNNFSNLPSKAVVTLKTDAGQVSSPLSQNILVQPNDFASIQWQIKVGPAGVASFEFSVKDDLGRNDTIVQKIDIRSSGYWQQSSEFKVADSSFGLSLPGKPTDPQKTELKMSLSSSMLGSLPAAMTYLINYPYGCTEQTTSGLLPKIISKKYPTIFSDALKQQSKLETIEDGIAKLTSSQNYDGGWPWWWGETNGYVTAYVYRLLTEARGVGVAVDNSLFANAERYFQDNFDKDTLVNKVVKAYGLSFSGNPKLYKTVLTDLNNLDADYLAMATIANISAGVNDTSKNGIDALVNKAKTVNGGVYWAAGSSDRFGSVETSTALAIQALVKSKTNLPLAASAINYLMKNRHYDYWASTYATAQTILAITDYSRVQKETESDLSYIITLDGNTLKSGKMSGIQSTPIDIIIDPGKVSPAGNLKITTSGTGTIYSTFTQKWWIKDSSSSKESHGVTISKKIINHLGEQYNLAPGDLVDIQLTVNFDNNTVDSNGYAIIEDHLPAGLIPVNTRLNNESEDTNFYSFYDYSREYLLDGIVIPIYYGNHSSTYSYQARVITGGVFNVPPANFSLMYSPETWARSESSTITVDSSTVVSPVANIINQTSKQIKKSLSPIRYIIIPTIFLIITGAILYVKKKKLK